MSCQLRCTSPAGIHGEPCGELTLRKSRKGLEGSGTLYGLKTSIAAERPVVAPASSPTIHTFEPRPFHLQFSDAPAPVLRIFSGDTVRTRTLDAAGRDEQEINRSPAGNPQTGPFYVEGAMPGKTPVVQFKVSGRIATRHASIRKWWGSARSSPPMCTASSSWTTGMARGNWIAIKAPRA